jgi:hypothetical protein
MADFISVKKAVVKLGMKKKKVMNLIKNKRINYKLENGAYVVDIDSIDRAPKLKPKNANSNKSHIDTSNSLVSIDDEMAFVLKETLNDFKCNPNHSYKSLRRKHPFIKVMEKTLTNRCVTDFDDLETLLAYFSETLSKSYNENPKEFVKWFKIQTPSQFYQQRSDYFNSPNYYNHTFLSSYFEHFYMFKKLTNGKPKIVSPETMELQRIKEFHSVNVA